jgi:hypothetical protein
MMKVFHQKRKIEGTRAALLLLFGFRTSRLSFNLLRESMIITHSKPVKSALRSGCSSSKFGRLKYRVLAAM